MKINPVDRPDVSRDSCLAERIAEDKAKAKQEVLQAWGPNGGTPVIYDPVIDPTEYDMVNKPKHYALIADKGVEVIDVIEAAVVENKIPLKVATGYGNVLKYLLRAGRKQKMLEDLKKAKFYLDRVIKRMEE